MGKTMGILNSNNIVINIGWYSDLENETDTLKEIYDKPVEIGDEYKDGKWYRNNEEVLSAIETIYKENDDMRNALNILGVK